MIAGETEYIIQKEQEDYFLKDLLNRSKTSANTTDAARKERRKQWWAKKKEGFQKAGGIEGIASTVGNIAGYFNDDTPYDYDISMGGPQAATPEKKGLPKEVLIMGGIAALVIIGFGISVMYKKSKTT